MPTPVEQKVYATNIMKKCKLIEKNNPEKVLVKGQLYLEDKAIKGDKVLETFAMGNASVLGNGYYCFDKEKMENMAGKTFEDIQAKKRPGGPDGSEGKNSCGRK
jgi:hypothetical protein